MLTALSDKLILELIVKMTMHTRYRSKMSLFTQGIIIEEELRLKEDQR